MVLPSASYLAEQTDTFDAESIFQARMRLRFFIATVLKSELESVLLSKNSVDTHDMGPVSAGKRALNNTCLGYLLELKNQEIFELCLQQLNDSRNMTDEIAALSGLSNFDCPQRITGINRFYTKWKSEELVLDKWFVTQALSRLPDTINQVKSLLNHVDFNLKNPNKVRSLIGAFCHGNHHLFHSTDGSGYAFCAEQVIKIDSINPQIAARLARAFDPWRRAEGTTRQHAKTALESIRDSRALSNDTFEIVNRALDDS